MTIGYAALVEHACKTRYFQHSGCRMPSLRSSEEHDELIALMAKHKDEILECKRRKFDEEMEFARSLPCYGRHIPTARLGQMLHVVIENKHRRDEIGEMFELVGNHAAEYPMPRQRSNYLRVVEWRKRLGQLLDTCGRLSGKPRRSNGHVRKEIRK